jgi:hypothetical protein
VPLDPRKIARIAANRTKIRQGRTETVTLVLPGTVTKTYPAVVVETGHVGPGVSTRSGEVVRRPWDALFSFPPRDPLTYPAIDADLAAAVYIARTADPAALATARKYQVLEVLPMGLDPTAPDRYRVKARLIQDGR